MVAGRGVATATMAGIPMAWSNGVAIADPPLPKSPDWNPTLRLFHAPDQLPGGFEHGTPPIEELRDLFGNPGRGAAAIERGLHLHIVRHRADCHVGHLDTLLSLGRNGVGDGLLDR